MPNFASNVTDKNANKIDKSVDKLVKETKKIDAKLKPELKQINKERKAVAGLVSQKRFPNNKVMQKQAEKSWFDRVADFAPHLLSAAKNLLPLILGFGDYTIEENSIMKGSPCCNLNQVPMVRNTKKGFIFSHREYIGDVLSSTSAFALRTFPINPAMNETFPLLSFIASCFTTHKWRGLLFELFTEHSDYSATGPLGYMAMATQYNAGALPFAGKKEMLNYEYATSSKPSVNQIHPVECKKSDLVLSELYNRSGPASGDIRFYDLGTLSVAVGGQGTGGLVMAELWATYEVELKIPKSIENSSQTTMSAKYVLNGVTAAAPFGAGGKTPSGANTMLLTFPTNASVRLPDHTIGMFLFVYIVRGTVAGALVNPITSLVNLTQIPNQFNGAVDTEAIIPNATTTTAFHKIFLFTCDASGATREVSLGVAGTFPTGTVFGDLIITQIPTAPSLSDMFRPAAYKEQSCVNDAIVSGLTMVPEADEVVKMQNLYKVWKEEFSEKCEFPEFVKIEELVNRPKRNSLSKEV